jgi:hypothetical protein
MRGVRRGEEHRQRNHRRFPGELTRDAVELVCATGPPIAVAGPDRQTLQAHHTTNGDDTPDIEPAQFTAFTDPGYAKIAFSIHVEPDGTRRTLVITQTRTATIDARSRRRFAVYCKLIGPCSALIRRLVFGW